MNDGQKIAKLEERLEQAKNLLMVAVSRAEHEESCPARKFFEHNKYLPLNHPAWKSAPACDCWVSSVKAFFDNQ